MRNKDTVNQHKQAWSERGTGQVLPRNYKQEPVVLQSNPGYYEKVHSKYLIWLYWVSDCECWLTNYYLATRGVEDLIDNAMTPIMQDNTDHDDTHISEGIDWRLERAEDYLDAIIPGRI